MHRVRLSSQLLVRALLVMSVAVLLLGATGDSRARFNDLGHHLMCTCGCNQVLLECNHVGCSSSDKMRAELKEVVDKGGSDDDVLKWFTEKYGNTVLAAPTKSGFNLVAWVMPFVALGAGIALCIVVVRTWKRRAQPLAAVAGNAELDSFRQRAREETEI